MKLFRRTGRAGRELRRRVRDESGAALMIVLVTLVGLTALAAAGLIMSESDIRVTQNMDAGTRAFYAADATLKHHLGTVRKDTSAATYSLTDGSATVTTRYLLDVGDLNHLYQMTSTATYTPPEGGVSSRSVSAMVLYGIGRVKVAGAFTSPNGLNKSGASGVMSGFDSATGSDPKCPGSPGPAVAGVAVPPMTYTETGKKSSIVPEGSPAIDDTKTAKELLDETGIDWDGMVNGGTVAYDYTIPPDSWPNFSTMDPSFWPVIYMEGSVSLSNTNSGRGMLVVRGDATLTGAFDWKGILLVGGKLVSNGSQTIEGAVVSGLNLQLGESVAPDDLGNGNKTFVYNSCYLRHATVQAWGGFVEVPGTWAERL